MKPIKTFFILLFLLSVTFNFVLAEVPDLKKAKEYQGNIPVRIVKELRLPKGYHEGLFFDGETIWVNNGENGNTWLIDVNTGKLISEIIPPGTFSEGITMADDGSFWITDWDEKKLYRVKIEQGKMNVEYDIELDPARPTGVVWTGKNLYVITWVRGMGTKYYLMQLDEEEHMFRKMRIKKIYEPSQLAWDGKYLWISSWYSDLVYKIDVDTFRVLGAFKSPAPKTTGITWDGKYMWVTGTYAGLYQLEIGEK